MKICAFLIFLLSPIITAVAQRPGATTQPANPGRASQDRAMPKKKPKPTSRPVTKPQFMASLSKADRALMTARRKAVFDLRKKALSEFRCKACNGKGTMKRIVPAGRNGEFLEERIEPCAACEETGLSFASERWTSLTKYYDAVAEYEQLYPVEKPLKTQTERELFKWIKDDIRCLLTNEWLLGEFSGSPDSNVFFIVVQANDSITNHKDGESIVTGNPWVPKMSKDTVRLMLRFEGRADRITLPAANGLYPIFFVLARNEGPDAYREWLTDWIKEIDRIHNDRENPHRVTRELDAFDFVAKFALGQAVGQGQMLTVIDYRRVTGPLLKEPCP